VIEVIKKMVDVLFAHINTLTKDLYEFSHYDQKEIETNKAKYYENLEKEIKIQEKLRREQVKELVQSDKDKKTLQEEIETLRRENNVASILSTENRGA
jgi:CHASE3 domain sensor protein